MGEHAAAARLVTSFAADADELLELAKGGVEIVEVSRPKGRHSAEIPSCRLALHPHAALDGFMVRTAA